MKKQIRFFSEVQESILMAFRAVISNKLRSILTLLGILVGVFSIILVMTAMRALQGYVENELSGLGANTAQIKKWPSISFEGPSSWQKYARRTDLDYNQFKKLRERATMAKGVSIIEGFRTDEASSRFETSNPNINLQGVTAQTFSARNIVVEEGRAITETDVESRRNVCLLGYELAKKLFPYTSALGETVRFDSINYLVIGVLEKKGSLFDAGSDNMILVPLTTAMNYYGHRRSMNFLVEAADRASYEDTIEQVRGDLRSIRRLKPEEDDFEIESSSIRSSSSFERHPFHTHRHHGRELDCTGRSRYRHYEHHARIGHRAHSRNRGPARHWRQEAQHHDSIHHGSGRALPDGRHCGGDPGRPGRQYRRQIPQCTHDGSGRLGRDRTGDLLGRRHYFRLLPGLESR